jgi:hypothetical protein
MKFPPRKAPGAGELTGRKLIALVNYHATAFFAKLFSQPFWFFEQKRTRLLDRLDNEWRER